MQNRIGMPMSMAPCDHIRLLVTSFLLLLCLCIMISYCTSAEVHDGDDQGLNAIGVVNTTQPNVCYHSEVPKNSFQIVHRYGPCSLSNSDTVDNYEDILWHDILRVAYFQHRVRSYKTARNMSSADLQPELVQITIPVAAEIDNSLFYVLVGMGTPKSIQSVNFDTGSIFSWIQCRPCQPCMPQQNPLFDPTLSHSYRTVSCNDPACTQIPRRIRGCTNNTCTYTITYVDLDSTKGIVSRELLRTSGGNQFPSFVFGCGHQNMVRGRGSSGLFGMGRGFPSLVSQTSSRFGQSFSYCLPSSGNIRGYLSLGHNEDASTAIYTPMLQNPEMDSGFYFINLTAISVNNRRLQMPSLLVGRRGTIIDSGTTVTQLPSVMYYKLRNAFRQGMSRYQYQLGPEYITLDTCYRIRRPRFPFPSITLHFDGHADLALSVDQVFLLVRGDTYCFAFSPMQQQGWILAMIGNSQQRGIEVIYNIEQERIGFYRTTNCR